MCVLEPIQSTRLTKEIKNLIKGNAIKYQRYKDVLDTIDKKEIEIYQQDVQNAYERIFLSYYSIVCVFGNGQPYKSLRDMTNDINVYRTLKVSRDNNNSVLLPETLNLQFRAVHDYLHYLLQQPFNFRGEFNVYKAQKLMHTTKIGRQILYSEVVLQAAYCEYYGKFADKQKIVL